MGCHNKITDSWYSPSTGEAVVVKGNKWGTFICSVHPCESDFDIANRWDGWKFADAKCDIATAKVRAQAMRERFNGARHMYDAMYMSGKLPDDVERAMYRQVVVAEEQYEEANERYKRLKSQYSKYTDLNLSTRRIIRAKQAVKEE